MSDGETTITLRSEFHKGQRVWVFDKDFPEGHRPAVEATYHGLAKNGDHLVIHDFEEGLAQRYNQVFAKRPGPVLAFSRD